jgi:uncharacterized protein
LGEDALPGSTPPATTSAHRHQSVRFVISITAIRMKTIILLTISNTFMNLAWYGHLKFKDQPLWLVIFASWGIAFFEYVFQVPANRLGSAEWTVPQLKVMQECITLVVFTIVAFVLFRSPIRWNIAVSYGLIVAAVFFAFHFPA